MTIKQAVEIYTETTRKINEINDIVNILYKLQAKGIREYNGLDLIKIRDHLNNYIAVLKYNIEQDFAN